MLVVDFMGSRRYIELAEMLNSGALSLPKRCAEFAEACSIRFKDCG